MALEKVITEDKIEIVGEFKAVQVRTCTKVLEDGVELSSGYHRHVVMAGDDRRGGTCDSDMTCDKRAHMHMFRCGAERAAGNTAPGRHCWQGAHDAA